jgi:ADP-heptose:LPS heptosyltransferase
LAKHTEKKVQEKYREDAICNNMERRRRSFPEKETRKNKNLLTWKERRKEKRRKKELKQKDTVGKHRNKKKLMIKW